MTFLTRYRTRWLVRAACYIGIVSLLLMCWSAISPQALPVVVGMSLGQGLGVVAFLLYATAVFGDIYRGDVADTIPPSSRSQSGITEPSEEEMDLGD
ncbi:MAG: hypothetical protein KC731_33040 [Myxococcales bacterium]|nr:hypothetical protein [Myxococcales bacterium]